MCNSENKSKYNEIKDLENHNQVEVNIDPSSLTFRDWWNLKYSEIPNDIKETSSSYISNYSIDDLLKYYHLLNVAKWNGEIGYRRNEYDKIAEKTRLNKNFFYDLTAYIELDYLKYLREITKEYFTVNKNLGIEPDYYSSINDTAYIGFLTFNCSLVVEASKNDATLEEKIETRIKYLKENLPDIFQGFRITDVKYIDTVAGTSGFLSQGYLRRKSDDSFLRFTDYRKGMSPQKNPEKEDNWLSDSWNNSKKIESYYAIE